MKKLIKAFSCSFVLFTAGLFNGAFAQADSHASMHAPVAKTITNRVMEKVLTDTGLINKKLRAIEYTFAPGYIDTISHRHGAEVFIYVVEGALEHRLGKNERIICKKGQMLHEPPYALHTLTKNASNTEPLKVLITFVYTDGPNAPKFIREYPAKK